MGGMRQPKQAFLLRHSREDGNPVNSVSRSDSSILDPRLREDDEA